MDEKMCQMINDGRITSVSIGAMVENLTENDEGTYVKASGIEFVELSLVAVPADPNAGFSMNNDFAMMVCEKLKSSKKVSSDAEPSDEAGSGDNPAPDDATAALKKELDAANARIAELEKKKEDTKMGNDNQTDASLADVLKAMAESQKATSEALKSISTEVAELKKAQAAPAPAEKKDATKGIVTSSRVDKEKGFENEEGLVIETSYNGRAAMWKKPGPKGELPR